MTDIGRDMRLYITGLDLAVLASVGTKWYPNFLPQIADRPPLPAVVYQVISNVPRYDAGGDIGVDTARVQLTSYARTIDEATDINTSLRQHLSGFVGAWGQSTIFSVFIGAMSGQRAPHEDLEAVITDYLVTFKHCDAIRIGPAAQLA